MKWVVLAIVLFVIGYTLVMIFFRKPGQAHQPYDDAKQRAKTARLVAAGYQQVLLSAERPADPAPSKIVIGHTKANVTAASGGIDSELAIALAERPLMAESITQVTATADSDAKEPYRVLFSATLRDHKRMISGGVLFRRANQLYLLPIFEPIQGQLLARTKETTVILTVPAGVIPPGKYQTTLIGENSSRRWDISLK